MSKAKKTTPTPEELKQQAAAALQSLNSTMWQIGQDKPATPQTPKPETTPQPPVQPEPEPAAQTPPEEPAQQEPTPEPEQPAAEPQADAQEPAAQEPTETPTEPQDEPQAQEPTPEPTPEPEPQEPAPKPEVKPKSYTPPNLDAHPVQQPGPAAPIGLSEEEEESIRTLGKMEAMYPGQYRNLVSRTLKFWEDEQKWIENWQAKNPEDQFDANSNQEYSNWVARNEPKFDQFHFKKAEKALWQEEVEAKAEAKIREVENRKKSEQLATTDQPEVVQSAFNAFATMVSNASPELGKAFAQAKQYDPAKMEEVDPVANAVVLEEGEELHVLVRTVEKLARIPDPAAAPKLLNNPTQLKATRRTIRPLDVVADFAYETEQAILSRPEAEQLDQHGRRFVGAQQYNGMLDRIDKSGLPAADKAQAKRQYIDAHWTLGVDELKQTLTDFYTVRAKERIQKLKPRARGTTPPAQAPAQKPVSAPAQNPPGSRNRTPSPAVVSSSDAPNPGKDKPLSKAEENKIVEARMWGL